MKKILAPSILSADFKVLGEQVCTVAESGAEFLHFDVMDGMFVPNISFGIPVLESLKGVADIIMDVHLMIMDPIRYVEAFKNAGADYLTVHYEACPDLQAVLDKIHECGMKAGITLNPGTDIEVLYPYIDQAEMFLIMSVEPGKGGQSFIPSSVEKIEKITALRDQKNPGALIEVDGGIKKENAHVVLDAGVDVIVAGSAVFKDDIAKNVKDFLEILKGYEA